MDVEMSSLTQTLSLPQTGSHCFWFSLVLCLKTVVQPSLFPLPAHSPLLPSLRRSRIPTLSTEEHLDSWNELWAYSAGLWCPCQFCCRVNLQVQGTFSPVHSSMRRVSTAPLQPTAKSSGLYGISWVLNVGHQLILKKQKKNWLKPSLVGLTEHMCGPHVPQPANSQLLK